LTSLLATVGRGRRRSRLRTWTVAAAAAAVLAISVLPPQADSALAMRRSRPHH
jgi:hypothetical protein